LTVNPSEAPTLSHEPSAIPSLTPSKAPKGKGGKGKGKEAEPSLTVNPSSAPTLSHEPSSISSLTPFKAPKGGGGKGKDIDGGRKHARRVRSIRS